MTIHNIEIKHLNLLIEGLRMKFSMIVDFLKHRESVLSHKNENIRYINEYITILDESLKSSFKTLNNTIDIYLLLLLDDELMIKEIFPITRVQDTINYFKKDKNLKEFNKKKVSFLINILEAQINFFDKKINLIENFHKKEKYPTFKEDFAIEYNRIFEEYALIFDKEEDFFYKHFYVLKFK